MKRMNASLLFTSVILMSSHVHAQGGATDGLQAPQAMKFDTRYNSTDPKIVVFDDGQQTYVALPKEMTTPIVMSFMPAGEILLQPTKMSPYLMLPGVHKKLKFLWGNARDILVTHTGPSGLERNGAAAAFGAVAPVALHGAIAKPVLSDVKKQAVKETELPKSETPIAVQPVDRAEARPSSMPTSPVATVLVGADTAAAAPASDFPTSPTATTPAQAPNAPTERLSIQAGQRLSAALAAWLKSQDITLSWEPAGSLPGRVRDVVIDSAWLSSQASLEPTLSEVLAPFGLTAHILRQRQTTDSSNAVILDASPTSVVVRNASNARP